MGYAVVLLWIDVRNLPGLCLSLVDLIPQEDRRPIKIYD